MKQSDPKLTCINWDTEQPTALNCKGNGRTVARKVKTKGIKVLEFTVLDEAEALLRQGWEVRLAAAGKDAALRLFPCVKTDMKTMFVGAQTMHPFRSCLSDKTVRLSHRGHAVSRKYAKQLNNEKRQSVTPDIMVTCPGCDLEFRVGQKLH